MSNETMRQARPESQTSRSIYNTSFHINLQFSDFCRNFPQWMKPYNHSECACHACWYLLSRTEGLTYKKKSILRGFGSFGKIVNRNGLTSLKGIFLQNFQRQIG